MGKDKNKEVNVSTMRGEPDNSDGLRKFGTTHVGGIARGRHLCQFYFTKKELIDILVPYFAEGLKKNEFCMWVASPPLEAEQAKRALRRTVSDLDKYISTGRIEILPSASWYHSDGKFDAERLLSVLMRKEEDALHRGFKGLRATGNTFWLERKDWDNFIDYEAKLNAMIPAHRVTALCTYSLEKCTGSDVLTVLRNHLGTYPPLNGN